jgi:succinoglycan biosynthesis protein ExoA
VNTDMPTVSVVIPARNAAVTLVRALASIAEQDYPNIVDVVVAAGDAATSKLAADHGAVVVENPDATTPAGLNLALSASAGDVIVRCDAHSRLPRGYVTDAVKTLIRTGADNVGGMQVPIGETFWEQAIAVAMSSALGAGDARYRVGGAEGPAETVYLGVFPRTTLQRLGGFDERFERNQDYELNHRIITSGGLVWFDPDLRVEYRPRGSLRDLASQYHQYGIWRRRMSRLYPKSLRWRQRAAPVLLVGIGVSLMAGLMTPWALVAPAIYLLTVGVGGLIVGREHGASAFGVPPALVTMHISWGTGFFRG